MSFSEKYIRSSEEACFLRLLPCASKKLVIYIWLVLNSFVIMCKLTYSTKLSHHTVQQLLKCYRETVTTNGTKKEL